MPDGLLLSFLRDARKRVVVCVVNVDRLSSFRGMCGNGRNYASCIDSALMRAMSPWMDSIFSLVSG